MRLILLFGLILLPFAEIWGYFKFGSLYGWWFLLYLIVMTVLGWRLIQEEKTLVLSRFMSIMEHGGNPMVLILGTAKNLMAGGLFLFPGIFSDIIAIILLLIPIKNNEERQDEFKANTFNKKKDSTNKGDVIEGEYRREDEPE
jgi:UPF0716 protein FxsA|tara:strand:- start:424 stop:852 length:429 start_codon:yes stop_codon:yes gene_type:complete